jgi:thymidylate kinase
MSSPYDIVVTITGGEHSGKTSLLALIGELLHQHEIDVTIARLDNKLDEKTTHIDESIARVKRSKILITERQTFPSLSSDTF